MRSVLLCFQLLKTGIKSSDNYFNLISELFRAFFMLFFVICWYFSKSTPLKNSCRNTSNFKQCQTVWIQMSPCVLANQRVCKGYQQTESVGKNLKYFLLKKVIVDYYKLVACWEFVSLFFFLSADFFAHLSRRLYVSYCDQSSSAVCRP